MADDRQCGPSEGTPPTRNGRCISGAAKNPYRPERVAANGRKAAGVGFFAETKATTGASRRFESSGGNRRVACAGVTFSYPLVVALLVAALSLLALRAAPPWLWAWKAAIAATEYGHWLVLFPLGVAGLAWFEADGGLRWGVLALCAFATVALLRPSFAAAKLARDLPRRLERELGPALPPPPERAFRVRRLFWRERDRAVVPRTEIIGVPDGVPLALDFYAASSSPAPCLVVVHGGGWDGGDRTQLDEWNAVWAARGYAVAAVSYRLAPRFTWPAQRDDVRTAIDWLKRNAAELGIDATRLVLIGRSAGGQIATAVAYGANDPAIVGVVSFYAPQDMPFAWSVSSERDALNSMKLMRQYLGGPPDSPERVALYASASAQAMIGAHTPPTLLLHGAPDTLVWVRHSERLAARLGEAGVKHVFVRLPWATHGFDFNRHGPGGQLADFAVSWFLAAVTGGSPTRV